MQHKEPVSSEEFEFLNSIIGNNSEIHLTPDVEDYGTLEFSEAMKKFQKIFNNGIVRIDVEDFKKNYTVSIAGLVELTASNQNDDIKKIKLNLINEQWINLIGEASCILTIIGQDNVKQYYLLKDQMAENVKKAILDLLKKKLPDDCVELRSKKGTRTTRQPLPSSFWSESGPWYTDKKNMETYKNTIDSINIEAFKKILIQAKNNGKTNLTVIDAGGGNGRLAEKLIQEANNFGITLNYTLIEPDSSQCEIANKTLNDLKCKNKIEIINTTIDEFEKNKNLYTQYQGKIDFIFSSGGPLNLQVVSHSDAIKNLKIFKNMLNQHGQLIATGKSHLAINRKEMENNGFTVNKTIAISEESTYDDLNQLYILTKKQESEMAVDEKKQITETTQLLFHNDNAINDKGTKKIPLPNSFELNNANEEAKFSNIL